MSKNKILIFIGSLTNGGAERVTVSLSRYLSKIEKYEVVVVTLNDKSYDFYSLDESVERIAMDMSGATKGLDKYTANIKRVLEFRRIVKNEKPDLVLGMITRQAIISIMACLGLPVKIVVSERNYPALRKNHSIWEILRSFLYRLADAHVVQTQKIADWIAQNAKAKNIHIIPNSIQWPLPIFKPRLDPSDFIDEEKKLILAVGSLKEQKGFDLLIQAVSGFLKNSSNWKLVILGDEVDDDSESEKKTIRKKLNDLIDDNDLRDTVIMPGRAGNVGEWYNRADIFVLSSRFEGFPNVLLEAMASGTACVAFDCDTGPRDLIEDNVNGFLVEPENLDVFGTSIQKMMKDEHLRRKFSELAMRKRVEYSEEIILKKWTKVFEELIPLR